MSFEIPRVDDLAPAYKSEHATSLLEAVVEALRKDVSLSHFLVRNGSSDLRGIYGLFNSSVFRNKDFSHSEWYGITFDGLQFRNCNFSGTKFDNCLFNHTVLADCELSGRFLFNCRMAFTTLIRVNFGKRVHLFSPKYCTFHSCRFLSVSVGQQVFWRPPLFINCLNYGDCEYEWPVVIGPQFMEIGCQRHTHQEWADFDNDDIDAMSADALEFWSMHKERLLDMCSWYRAQHEIAEKEGKAFLENDDAEEAKKENS